MIKKENKKNRKMFIVTDLVSLRKVKLEPIMKKEYSIKLVEMLKYLKEQYIMHKDGKI